MKRKLASFLFALSVVGSMTSCEEMNYGEGQLPPLAGEVVFTDVTGTSAARVSPNFVLGVELSNGSGAALEAVFSCSAPVLQAGTYTEASAGYATAGNFITGADGTTLTINGEKHLVTAGTIKVAENGGTYTFDGIVKLGNGENYSFKWTGSGLAWTGLPELKKLSVVTSAQSNLANGVKSITLNLSDGNWSSTLDMTTWQTVYTGKGNYLAIDIYSEDGYLAAGTYSPSATGGAIEKGQYGIGWDPGDIYNMGMMFENWGTCWWTVDEAATPQTSAEKITTGNITVAIDENSVYTITVDNGELYVQFTGEIPAVTKPAAPADPWEIAGSVVFQHEGLTFTMTDDTANNTKQDGSALDGVTLYWLQIKDAAGSLVAELDLVTKQGATSFAGEYKVTSYPDEVGEAGNGFYIDLGAMGWGEGVMSGGTILYGPDGTAYVIDADKSNIKITENKGQTIIIVKGTTNGATIAGKYVIGEPKEDEGGEGEGGGCGCDCDGCKDCTGGSGDSDEDEGGESFNGERLTTFLSLTPNTGIVSAQLGTAGLSVVQSDWGAQISGEGNYLKFDAYSADGTLAAGVYRASAVGGVVGEGEFSIGYDTTMDFGWGPMEFTNWGTCWMTRNADGSETGVKITDGTLTVEISGETYTITLESSALNAQYVGPLK
ncbi:MAG: hypothetical protein IJN30_04295 [Bacteroidales bacterium]|nr:hypothetical protein [Bacteroidales bacterium]